MKRKIPFCFFVLFLACSSLAQADAGPMEKLADRNIDRFEQGCEDELETYCQTVTPGEGRGLACIYAHKDKLSGKCENALYESAEEFRNAANKLNAFVGACQADIVKLCSKVAIGEGRILKCLDENQEKISAGCRAARPQVEGDLGQKKAEGQA